MRSKSIGENISEANRITAELLITDAKTALTLLDLAETTEIAEDRSRRIGQAQHAYQSITSIFPRVGATPEQVATLGREMRKLEARLRAAGALAE